MSEWYDGKWLAKAEIAAAGLRELLTLLLNELNQGQRQKLMKNEKISERLEMYGVKPD